MPAQEATAALLGSAAQIGIQGLSAWLTILTVQWSDWRTPRSFADRIVPGAGPIPPSPA